MVTEHEAEGKYNATSNDHITTSSKHEVSATNKTGEKKMFFLKTHRNGGAASSVTVQFCEHGAGDSDFAVRGEKKMKKIRN